MYFLFVPSAGFVGVGFVVGIEIISPSGAMITPSSSSSEPPGIITPLGTFGFLEIKSNKKVNKGFEIAVIFCSR